MVIFCALPSRAALSEETMERAGWPREDRLAKAVFWQCPEKAPNVFASFISHPRAEWWMLVGKRAAWKAPP